MKIQLNIKRMVSRILCKGSLLAACSVLPLISEAAPHWDVSGPGEIHNAGNTILTPMAAKNGALYAINYYTDGGTSHLYELVRWTKCAGFWSYLFGFSGTPAIDSLYISGDYLYVSGVFSIGLTGGGTAVNIAKYNVLSEQWSAVGDGSVTDEIRAVTVDSNGRVYIASGSFGGDPASTHSLVQYWSGTAWTTVGSGMRGSAGHHYQYALVTTLAADGTDIYIAGNFDAGVSGSTITYSTNIIKWDGTSWHAMGTPAGNGIVIPYDRLPVLSKIVVSGSDVFVTGDFDNFTGDPPPIGLDRFSTSGSHVQAYSLWGSSGSGYPSYGSDLSAQNGTVYLAGGFSYIDSTSVYAVAQWNGSTWSALSSGVSGGVAATALAVDVNASHPENALYVLGSFDHAGGSAIPNGTPVRWVLGADNMNCSVVGRISAGLMHSLALKYDGTVWAWGDNSYGQLGNGTYSDSSTPKIVTGLTNIIAIAAGWTHNLALKSDGTVWAWGLNNVGQLGNNSTTTQNTPIQVPNLSGVIYIAAGAYHSLARSSDDFVAWGYNADGELGDGSYTERHVPTHVSNASGLSYYNVYAIAAGAYHSLAIGPGGQLWAWGANNRGQLGDGTTSAKNTPETISAGGESGVKAISGGLYHTMALDNDSGYVWVWGDNTYAQLGNGSTGSYSATPTHYWSTYSVQAIAAGTAHSLAVDNSGHVWSWGYNDHGQLGDNSTTTRSTPVQVSGLSGITTVSGGGHFSLSAGNASAIYSWGANSDGQLGDGNTTDSLTPVTVSGFIF